MFGFIKKSLTKIYTTFTSKLSTIFSQKTIDEKTVQELEKILLSADTGVRTTKKIIENIRKRIAEQTIAEGADLQTALQEELISLLDIPKKHQKEPSVYLMVGINGSGKTTFSAKLAHTLRKEGKKVLLVAADTFRAAATEQLEAWANKVNVSLVTGTQGADPASVVYKACEQFKADQFDVLIIDTAGRLQTKTNLMKELEKIKRIITRQLPDKQIETLLAIDAMLGQNSFQQAKLFNESTALSGIVLTKMDGTGKGGIVFAIAQELQLPVTFISFGEQIDQSKPFNKKEYVKELLEIE